MPLFCTGIDSIFNTFRISRSTNMGGHISLMGWDQQRNPDIIVYIYNINAFLFKVQGTKNLLWCGHHLIQMGKRWAFGSVSEEMKKGPTREVWIEIKGLEGQGLKNWSKMEVKTPTFQIFHLRSSILFRKKLNWWQIKSSTLGYLSLKSYVISP